MEAMLRQLLMPAYMDAVRAGYLAVTLLRPGDSTLGVYAVAVSTTHVAQEPQQVREMLRRFLRERLEVGPDALVPIVEFGDVAAAVRRAAH